MLARRKLCVIALTITVTIALVLSFPFFSVNQLFPSRLVGAYYYAWYKPQHWLDCNHPDTPLLGYYDSTDSAIITQHLQWASEYSIDFFTISLWTQSTTQSTDLYHTHDTYEATKQVFDKNAELGNPVKLCVLIEPRTADELQTLIEQAWQLTTYSSYLTWNSKPLLLIYTQYINSYHPPTDTRFTTKLIPTETPYYNENLQTSFVGDIISVKPGADVSYLYTNRQNGTYYQQQWQFAIQWAKLNTYRNLMVLITSFNEYWEATQIEPSTTWSNPYGYLEITKHHATLFKQTALNF